MIGLGSRWAQATLFSFATVVMAGCFAGGGAAGGATAAGAPATLTIANQSNETIMYVYMSPSSESNWGADRLGTNVLAKGQTFTMSGIAPGSWDVRVEDRSRNHKEWRSQVFESGGSYTVEVNGQGWSR